MKNYRFEVSSDQGNFIIKVTARNETIAKEMIMKFENCPAQAIQLKV